MELLLAMKKGKLPFMGIVFENAMEACEFNQELINNKHDGYLKIILDQPKAKEFPLKCLQAFLQAIIIITT